MTFTIEPTALDWFRSEMSVQQGEFVRFFVRIGGCSTVQTGFSLGVAKEAPKEIGISTTIDEITFYMEKEDVWYLNEQNLRVSYNSSRDEIEFS
ncbi:HesB/YadR/YfhF family protein [Aneurinibacillus uraniidurans]|uniref:HesB/YadR/YfhF family protein n=1 Tax=Aneurinibacillus uraniidurans TaxID=2966586 RepID=UPI00234B0166|nr:HesB/YadR/YfhF family protein [Aneurinibacillus sp. B1]WCN37988.1 HesB/YadR/YfhF family protein [Aneurinibacillus sp. B1]